MTSTSTRRGLVPRRASLTAEDYALLALMDHAPTVVLLHVADFLDACAAGQPDPRERYKQVYAAELLRARAEDPPGP